MQPCMARISCNTCGMPKVKPPQVHPTEAAEWSALGRDQLLTDAGPGIASDRLGRLVEVVRDACQPDADEGHELASILDALHVGLA